ncbi:GAF domain-containing protein [Streptomyces sp. NBC_01381]|uniref:GAF domain-containing sensor histidine kinase n=1 Tax=Streptomyces sp. NBC_01381 TaxID=2903845 RepID=UPI00225BE001|nr:GAF domain-containing sensor histidine kinase [Streptomyces sp. NBC_01381]MCX4673704.1 GAF domain-containing protein [Streptomyces sp. NBC_01381]
MAGEQRGGSGQLPRLRLDELLEELQVRIDAVRGTRDRLHGLLEAVLSVGRELDLPQVLRRIVETAVTLVDAEYGALGVIGAGSKLDEFLPVGINEQVQAQIGDLPSGHGLLGELIRHPEPLRLRELSEHPASSGFPAHHPPMNSFLGVPIRVREKVFGNLYLTEKRGGVEFDAEDLSVLSTLAVAAGVAIENARLYDEARLRERWLTAGAELTNALLSGTPEARVLELMVERALAITSADIGVVDLVVAETQELQGALALGEGAEVHQGQRIPRQGTLAGAALSEGGLVATGDAASDPRVTFSPERWKGMGPAVAVPMGTADGLRGVLVLARRTGRPSFSQAEIAPLPGFAGQAALALELADRRRDAEQISLFEDRDRIARDLHDLAIQRLFATGMTLQSAQRFVQHPEASERLTRAVDDLDTTIKIIRSTIFGLRAHDASTMTGPGLRVRIARTLEEAVAVLGFTPALRMEGLIDVDVPATVADDAVAVLSEALANITRHAQASAADVSIVVRKGQLTLIVTDNGVGIDEGGHRSGLRNIAERAEGLGGTLAVGSGPDGGTRLEWRVPLPGR